MSRTRRRVGRPRAASAVQKAARRTMPIEVLIGRRSGRRQSPAARPEFDAEGARTVTISPPMANYMTRRQYERHLDATRQTEEKLNIARKKVGEAASHGDLSENAEYDAAVEESGFLAGRV